MSDFLSEQRLKLRAGIISRLSKVAGVMATDSVGSQKSCEEPEKKSRTSSSHAGSRSDRACSHAKRQSEGELSLSSPSMASEQSNENRLKESVAR